MVIGLNNKTNSKNIVTYLCDNNYKVIKVEEILQEIKKTPEYEQFVFNIFGPNVFDYEDNLEQEKLEKQMKNNPLTAKEYEEMLLNLIYSKVDNILSGEFKNYIIEWNQLEKTKYFYQCDKKVLISSSNETPEDYDFYIDFNSKNIEEDLKKTQEELRKISKEKIIGLFAGSFDPFHNGHLKIVKEAASHCDKLFVGIANNPTKVRHYDKEQMREAIDSAIKSAGIDNVETVIYDGMTIDFSKQNGINLLIRGYRNESNLKEEIEIAKYNKKNGSIGSYLIPNINKFALSSTYIRNLIQRGESIQRFVPQTILEAISLEQKECKNKK